MDCLPGKDSASGTKFTVADFFEAGREKLGLTLLSGAGAMEREIEEPILNRPGLALTGFLTDFAGKRVQVIGNSEVSYLNSLAPEERRSKVRDFLQRSPVISIFTNGARPPDEELAMADEYGVVSFSTPMLTRFFTHQAFFVLDRLSAPRTTIYGTMIEVAGLGVLFEGAPGLGKSETALGLIKRGCALVADDLTCLRKDSSRDCIFASASASTVGYIEIRGIGLINVPRIFGVNSMRGEKRLDLVITFKPLEEVREIVDRVEPSLEPKRILGVDIPNILLPVSEGRDLVNLVETAVQQHKLNLQGHSSANDLTKRLKDRFMKSAAGRRQAAGGSG